MRIISVDGMCHPERSEGSKSDYQDKVLQSV